MNIKRSLLSLAFLYFTTLCFAGTNPVRFTLPEGLKADDYLAKTIILRVDPDYRNSCSFEGINITSVQSILGKLGSTQIHKIFPSHQPPSSLRNEHGFLYADLSLIYELQYTADADLVKVINSLLQTGIFIYVEPKYLPKVTYIPNDPLMAANQQFLTRINAYDGWDVSKGDTNVVIGITDTGTDWDHPDLEPNLQLNYSDPINGIDDDNDGFTDNYRGWDLGENDNNPMVGTCFTCSHGSHVSGCAAGTTDNGIGIAAPGFNSRFLPVKIANASGALTKAYEGITYAADHGCQIINCSWGGGGGGSFGQNVIDYATINKNCLVIAAAGNNSSNALFYPAAYNYILSVAATNSSNDNKAGFSNYGTYIDVCAPGNNIYSTVSDDSYTSMNGTSMASPITAGVAAIVKSYFPSYSGLQVGEQVRITADNIYSLPQNSLFANSLGTGRINLLNALTISSPSIRMNPINTTDNVDNIFLANDTLYISGDLTNFLAATASLGVTLSSASPYVTIIDNFTNVGVLGTMATTNNNADPFIVKVNSNAPQNASILFKLTFQDGTYSDFQMYSVIVNVDYVNITVNDVWTTNTSKGRLCYNGEAQAEGLGFDYNSQGTLTYEAGFMAGTNSVVADNVRGVTTTNNDWASLSNIVKNSPGFFSDFDTYGRFSDASNPAPLGIAVKHRSFSWSSPPDAKYHIFEYTIYNNSPSSLSNFWAGIFSDWDIQNYNNNKASEDPAAKLGYVWCTDTAGLFAGIRLLTPGAFNHYAIDNISGGSGGVDLVASGFSDSEKFTTLSTPRATAGGAGTGNDVIDVVGTGPFNMSPGDSVTVAFALIAGNELGDLINSANLAQIQYNQLTGINENSTAISNLYLYPNPATDFINVDFNLLTTSEIIITIYDLSGRIVIQNNKGIRTAGNQSFQISTQNLNGGCYLAEIKSGNTISTRKVILSESRK
jgi:serine protease